jgi:RNA polymerase sigma-70 factor (ECF subfamily)
VEEEQLKLLIKQCVAGKRLAQKKLFEQFYGKLLGACMRYISDHDQAQEVVQEGFIKIFDNMADFDFKGSFEGWMRRIIVNAAIDKIRYNKRQAISTDNDFLLGANQYDEDDSVANEFLIKLKAEEALKAVQSLSAAYRTVFNLYVIENYSHREIAEILGISEGTSKSNLAKAKQNLRKLLEEKFSRLDNEL